MKQEAGKAAAVTAAVVGTGHRGIGYAAYGEKHPDAVKIVAVAEPDDGRRRYFAERFGIPEAMRFRSAEDLAAAGRVAEAAINATMDRLHVPTSLPLLKAGYDLLLEKPIATNERDLRTLYRSARQLGRKVMICHVLRYAPFYALIRQRVAAGEIGRIMAMETVEHVSYHHMAVGFVRGKWSRKDRCESSMLMAKCCHDLDLQAWMKSGVPPKRVSSFGSRTYFREECAPAGSGTRCLVDCKIEASCPYSARKHYVEAGLWRFYAWEPAGSLYGKDLTDEQKMESLRTGNPFGRCVWRCDNDVVDHQTVIVEYADGATANHTMVGGTARPGRGIHLLGTEGEIQGWMEDGVFFVRRPDPAAEHRYREERVDVSVAGDMHGGGDGRLVADFVARVRGREASPSSTALEDSMYGHLIGFAADASREDRGRPVEIEL